MKKEILKMGLLAMLLLSAVSCKNKERELADKRISELESFVDSLKLVSVEERQANWEKIASDYDQKNSNANQSLSSFDEKARVASQEKIDASGSTYNELKVVNVTKPDPEKIVVVKNRKPNVHQLLRNQFFGEGKIGEDMSFTWVNKSNILKVYEGFFESYKANKHNFSREDYDETKLLYEALDSRKNTVEKEGLTSEDNGKIAAIKFKFAPMFKINRIGAKSKENADAKK